MSNRPSNETKIKRGQGQGTGADYKPFITTDEVNSLGTASVIVDWKTHRSVHCLSQGEAQWYYILRWDDGNEEVYEQFPLWDENFSNKDTVYIAKKLGVKHPGGPDFIMTTDFITEDVFGRRHAYSVKPNRNLSRRALENLCVEKAYWDIKKVPFKMLFTEDLNKTLATNIRLVTEFYDGSLVFDEVSAVKHEIAIKRIAVDMEHEIITKESLYKLEVRV